MTYEASGEKVDVSELHRVDLVVAQQLDSRDPTLDPSSGHFSTTSWFAAIKDIKQRFPSEYPLKPFGLSFRNLKAYGYVTASDHQPTFGTYPLRLLRKLWPTSSKSKSRVDILRSIDGIVDQGEMLLVLGRPGSGCTTLLKALAGESRGFSVGHDTHINYQGVPSKLMHTEFRGECDYTAELDVHFPELTVQQTLNFAVQARMPRIPLPGMNRAQQATWYREALIAMFGLRSAQNTKIGNDLIRGVSGGERKRVSLAEAMSSWSSLHCYDNSTRGLDSATALTFVRTIRQFANSTGSATIMTMYQASDAMYDTFDKVTLLYQGQQIFFGSCKEARDYFTELGFQCPHNATMPDFLTSLTHPVEARLLVRQGYDNSVPRTPDEFRQVWLNSQQRNHLIQEIENYEAKFPLNGLHVTRFRQALSSEKFSFRSNSPYMISVFEQLRICVQRNIQRLQNNWSAPLAAVIGNVIMGIIVGSIFYNLDTTTASFYNRSVLIFFATLLNGFMSSFEVLAMWVQRPIVEKHSRYAFYHPGIEAIASIIGDFPAKIITSILFNLAIYFLTNLRRTVGAFFTFYMFSVVCLVTMSMFFRMVGSLSRTMAQTMAPVAIFCVNYIIYAGFVIPPPYMHPWLRWVGYINPVGYAFESLMINEFSGVKYSCTDYIPSGPTYQNLESHERICSAVGAVTGQDYVNGSTFIQLSYNFSESHLWRNLGILIALGLFFCIVHLLAAEFIRPQASKGEVLLYRNSRDARVFKTDEESPTTAAVTSNKEDADFIPSGIKGCNDIVHWQNLCYDVETKEGTKRLLTEVNGWVKQGTLTALMGVTGAGKTTLLDVLADRAVVGVISGEILVNGRTREHSFQRKTGYVKQQDLHLATSTVREALNFSALMRQPAYLSRSEKLAYVEEVVRVLDMETFANAIVGEAGESLNIEQRKRLSIAVEMVAKPELLLFLDEPTSGLDSQTAWSICVLLRKLVAHGQAIMCTIHQPSAVLLDLFDQILLLEQPGKTVYFGPLGPNSETMIRYFEGFGAQPHLVGENPADWVLKVTQVKVHGSEGWGTLWDQSPEKAALSKELDKLAARGIAEKNAPVDHDVASSLTQTWHVLQRMTQEHWRTPTYVWSMFILCFGTAFFIGFSFYNSPNSIQGLRNQIFSIFLILTIFSNVQQLFAPKFIERRSLYEAVESRAKTYSWPVFVSSNILVELPWQLLISVALFAVWYYPVGLYKQEGDSSENERAALMFLCLWAYMTFCSTFSAMLAAGMQHAQTAVEIAQLLYYLILIFCGILVKAADLPRFWIFMYRVSPLTYLSSAMMSAGIANKAVTCSDIEVLRVTPPYNISCESYLAPFREYTGASIISTDRDKSCDVCPLGTANAFLDSIGSRYEERWRNLGIFVVFIVLNIVGTFALHWLTRVPKKRKKKV